MIYYSLSLSISISLALSLLQLSSIKEILVMGYYQLTRELDRFIKDIQKEFQIPIRFVCTSYVYHPMCIVITIGYSTYYICHNCCSLLSLLLLLLLLAVIKCMSSGIYRNTVVLVLVEAFTILGIRYLVATHRLFLFLIPIFVVIFQSLKCTNITKTSSMAKVK